MAPHVVLLKTRARQQGGLEKVASRIADGFLRRGANVTLLTTGRGPSDGKIACHGLETSRWPGFLRLEQYDRFVSGWLKKNRADLVFGMERNRRQTHLRAGNGVHATFLQRRILSEGRFKHLVCQINPLHRKILELERAAFEYEGLQKLIANSRMVRDEILAHYRTDPSKIEVIHNGVEWEEMAGDFADWEEKKRVLALKWRLDPSRFHFLFIGNGYLRKGLGQLLHALALVKNRSFHLTVIGKDKREGAYQALASRLRLTKQVTFLGPQKEIRPFYQFADALVIPSFYDPFANVTVEALAMGLFIVSSRYNGGSEVLNSETGTVISDLTDPASLADALHLAMRRPKSAESARRIRESVRSLDYSEQLGRLLDLCLPRSP